MKSATLTAVWQKALNYLKEEDYESAYRAILNNGDDMYLLRLIATTDKKSDLVLKSLDIETSSRVLARINKIVRGGIFEHHLINWLDGSRRWGHFDKLNDNEKNEYMDTLFQLSRTKLHGQEVVRKA